MVRVQQDPGGQVNLNVDQPRSINLVLGLSYNIHCQSSRGFSGVQNVWLNGTGMPVRVEDEGSRPPVDQEAIYVISDGNQRTLVIQLFSAAMVGEYRCQAPDGSGDAIVTLGMSEYN